MKGTPYLFLELCMVSPNSTPQILPQILPPKSYPKSYPQILHRKNAAFPGGRVPVPARKHADRKNGCRIIYFVLISLYGLYLLNGKFIGLGQGTVGDPFSVGVERLKNIKVRSKPKGGTGIKSMGFELEITRSQVIDLSDCGKTTLLGTVGSFQNQIHRDSDP